MGVWTKGGTTGRPPATRARQGGRGHPDDAGREVSRPTAAGRARIRPAKRRRRPPWNTGFILIFRPFQAISGHFRPPHTSLPPFLDPLSSFPWSLFADSSPFERYDKNKVGRLLDRVFRPPQRLLNQGNGTNEFLVSWAFH